MQCDPYSLEELWTLFDFVRPDYLGPLVQFRDQTINPIKRGQKRDASDWEVAHRTLRVKWLNTKFKDIVLRRDKSVIKDLLPEKTDHIGIFDLIESLQFHNY
jgi:transcriptional regulator ATRX